MEGHKNTGDRETQSLLQEIRNGQDAMRQSLDAIGITLGVLAGKAPGKQEQQAKRDDTEERERRGLVCLKTHHRRRKTRKEEV